MYTKKLSQKAVPESVEGFPPSVQSDLFQYLKPAQQDFLKPILRLLKPRAQEELCVALIDYLETGIPEPPITFNLGVIFLYIIHNDEPKGTDPADAKFLYPLRTNAPDLRPYQPKSVGTILKQMFNK